MSRSNLNVNIKKEIHDQLNKLKADMGGTPLYTLVERALALYIQKCKMDNEAVGIECERSFKND